MSDEQFYWVPDRKIIDFDEIKEEKESVLREEGPEPLEYRERRLNRRIPELEEKLEHMTERVREKLLAFLRSMYPDRDDAVLRREATMVAGGVRGHGHFEEALERVEDPNYVQHFRRDLVGRRNAKHEQIQELKTERNAIEAVLDAGKPPEAPVNPFENTSKAYDYCQQVIEAYHTGLESPRPMEQMKDLWREVGKDSEAAQQSVRNVLKRAGKGYEGGNPTSFVTAVEEVVSQYNDHV